MTDRTADLTSLVKAKPSAPGPPPPKTADEFLKEAYRINSHIASLLTYLHSIRTAYLTPTPAHRAAPPNPTSQAMLTDHDRDEIDTSTTLLLRSLSTSISNLSSAESLRQETESSLLRRKYAVSPGTLLRRWAGGAGALPAPDDRARDEEVRRVRRTVRESVLWFLRRGLEAAAERQRALVERRVERERERERSVLYKAAVGGGGSAAGVRHGYGHDVSSWEARRAHDVAISEAEKAEIEEQLSPEQLQLFAEENDTMLRYYEDTLGKVQNAEKSLLEISSLQQTLVSHLSTQEEYIGQLVTDAASTHTNIGQGNKELKRATERRSTAQAVFWGTVGLCSGLVVWDLVF